MEDAEYKRLEERRIEKTVIAIYNIYNVGLTVISMIRGWNQVVIGLMIFSMVSIWFVNTIEYKSFKFRAYFTTVSIEVYVLVYGLTINNFLETLPIFTLLAVVIGLYGIKEMVYITVGTTSFLLFYHIIIAGSIEFEGAEDVIRKLMLIGSLYFAEYVVYHFISKKEEGIEKQIEVIDELKEVERSRDDFMANVSHEIRTPINTICGMSEVLLQDNLPQNIKDSVFNIQASGRNLMSIVSDILDFSEWQSGKMELAEEKYNITSTINDIINMTLARKVDKKIELIVDCDANIPSGLLGDEQKIRRVVMNLVNNAIKFTNEGCISIIIGFRKESYGINLSVTIRDTGIGMEEKSIEKLFKSFNQVDTKRNRKKGGIGLGLAISQAIVHKMGGCIMVNSRLGKGTEIRFVVPQKVYDDTPIASINDKNEINAAVYINMEQFEILEQRDAYTNNIKNIISQLDARCHVCKNFAELKRRQERNGFSHIFISIAEYMADIEYFDILSRKTKVILIIDRDDEKKLINPNLIRIYKPFYVLPVVMVLNEKKNIVQNDYMAKRKKFIAPEAHVMVVDDNIMNIKVMEGVLKNYKIKVTTATSGREALEKAETKDYDIIFMDHMMPEMDGIEALHRLREKVGNYYSRVPVIALTANAIAGTREMFLEEGFNEFVAKPVEISVLERVLQRNIPDQKMIFTEDIEEEENKAETEHGVVEDDEIPAIGNLDIKKGIMYCGGKEQYLDIIRMYAKNGENNREKIEKLYEKKDWKAYTIEVHAVKSAMLSIGATDLSEMAKKLEAAGKKGDELYIMANHKNMIAEYKRVFKDLNESIGVNKKIDDIKINEELRKLEPAEFEQMVIKLEDAMYAFDGEKMMSIADELQKCSFGGESLEELMAVVKRKINMSDYMSAVEMVLKHKELLKNSSNRLETED